MIVPDKARLRTGWSRTAEVCSRMALHLSVPWSLNLKFKGSVNDCLVFANALEPPEPFLYLFVSNRREKDEANPASTKANTRTNMANVLKQGIRVTYSSSISTFPSLSEAPFLCFSYSSRVDWRWSWGLGLAKGRTETRTDWQIDTVRDRRTEERTKVTALGNNFEAQNNN